MKKSIDQIKSDIACKRRYNWKSMIEYLIEEKSFDLIDKSVTEAMEEYAMEQMIEFAEWMDVSNYKFYKLIDGKFHWTTKTGTKEIFTTKAIYGRFKNGG